MTRGYARALSNAARSPMGKKVVSSGIQAIQALLAKQKGKLTARLTPSLALKGTKLKSYLDRTYQRKCGVEVKHYENQAAGLLVGTTLAQVEQFPNNGVIAQGMTDGTRIGNSIEIKKVSLNMTFYVNAGAINSTRVRAVLLRCHEATAGTTPPPSNILWAPGNIRSGFMDKDETVVAPNVPYSLVKAWDFHLDAPATGGNDRRDIRFNYHPKKCHAVRWLDTDVAGAVANIFEGALVLYVMYDGSFAPSLNTWHEFSYIDV